MLPDQHHPQSRKLSNPVRSGQHSLLKRSLCRVLNRSILNSPPAVSIATKFICLSNGDTKSRHILLPSPSPFPLPLPFPFPLQLLLLLPQLPPLRPLPFAFLGFLPFSPFILSIYKSLTRRTYETLELDRVCTCGYVVSWRGAIFNPALLTRVSA